MSTTKQTSVAFGGMNQDISIQKFPNNLYYEARNMKLNPVEGQTVGAISNSYGNKLALQFPEVFIDANNNTINYGNKSIVYTNLEIDKLPESSGKHRIIGDVTTRGGAIVFTTTDSNVDCIWEIPNLDAEVLDYKLLYVRNMGFSVDMPIQAVYNYENSLLQKIYWVDGGNFLRFINKEQSVDNGFDTNLIDNNLASINSRGEFTLRKPKVERSAGGGVHTAGVIQYGYTLYNLNGSETVLSPLSDLFPLDKGEDRGGGDLNEDVGAMPVVVIEDVDPDFTYLRLYSAKYTTFNGTPEIKMIYDGSIGNHTRFSFNDTGAINLGALSLEQLAFLGADPIIPKHIRSKDNILFAANNKVSNYELDIDTRAYSFDNAGYVSVVFDDVYYNNDGSDIPYSGDRLDIYSDFDSVPKDHDTVNLDFDTFRYKKSGSSSSAGTIIDKAVYAYTWNHPGDTPPANNLPLYLTSQYGEVEILNGKFVSSYTGTVTAVIESAINRNNSALGIDETNFFIEVRKNGAVYSVFNPILSSPLWNTDIFSTPIVVTAGDVIELTVKYLYIWNPVVGLDGPAFNIDFTGELSIQKGTQAGSNGEGGTGKFIEYELTRTPINLVNNTLNKFFKDNEIYRISITFSNKRGQATAAKWIADFKAPQGNLEGQLNTLNVSLTPEFYTYINSLPEEDRPVSYSILRARRSDTDKTIIAQGMLTGMFVQAFDENFEDYENITKRVAFNKDLVKLPIPMTRGYGTSVYKEQNYYPLYSTQHGETMNEFSRDRVGSDPRKEDWNNPRGYPFREVYTALPEKYKVQQTWQYTKMFQLQSPELIFNKNLTTTDYDELRVLGAMKRKDCTIWESPYDLDKFTEHSTQKSKNSFLNGAPAEFNLDTPTKSGWGVIGPAYRLWENNDGQFNMMRRTHVYKNFDVFIRSEKTYEIYGEPEISSIGHAGKFYNGDESLKYMNKLTTMVSDRARDDGENHDDGALRKITSVLSEGSRSLTIALGGVTLDAEDRPGLEDLYANTGIGDWDVELIAEIVKPKSFVYSGAIYNGYTNEAKNRTEYVQIGDTTDIDIPSVDILSPGDTFVQSFVCTRLAKTPGESTDIRTMSFVDTVEYLTETSINLKERSDKTWLGWDNSVDPTFEEAAIYNDVYSTDIQAITYSGEDERLKKIEQKEVEIIASKPKIPGEFIENWVDFKVNEAIHLNGEFGPINNIVKFKDYMFAFQDSAVSYISINPRVQVQGQDNIAIELGSGDVLHDYEYITTTSGAVNKWGIKTTPVGIFYADILTKSIKRIDGNENEVSESKGMHSPLVNLIDREVVKEDNPLRGEGVVLGVDTVNGDVFSSFKQENEDTLSYNYKIDKFTSYYDFVPTRYINKGDRMFTVPSIIDGGETVPDDSIWVHGQDNFQSFYGTKYESYVTLLVNGENAAEKVFNNLEFNSEVTLDKEDIADITIDSITAWNNYQITDKVTLEIPKNLKRRFRTWRASVPREQNSRNRMSDKTIFLKLGFNPEEEYKLVLHDIIIKYS